MGDEVDTIGLPIHHQSGEIDIGHESVETTNIEQDQAGLLNTLVQSYYSGDTDVAGLSEGLRNLGYNRQQVTEIQDSTTTELYLRQHNAGWSEGTDFTPNQLEYLRDRFNTGTLENLENRIRTGEGGRQYLLGHGGDQRYYLPDPVPFDVLTAQQRTEADERDEILRDIDIREIQGTGEIQEDFTQEQRQQISVITTRYLNSGKTRADLMQFRNNIQRIEGIDSVHNIDNILFQYFLDVDYESEYRDEHNGLSQLLTQEQFDFMRSNQNQYHFSGQVIFETQEGITYFYGNEGAGKVPVPTQEFVENMNNIPTYTNEFDVQLSNADYNELDRFIRSYMSDNITETDLRNAIISVSQFNPDSRTKDPYRFDAHAIATRYVELAIEEKRYREVNDGRPSQLSGLQYEFLMNHELQEGETRYEGGLIGTNRQGVRYYYIPSVDDRDMMLIPTDEQIQGFIDSGFYTRPVEQEDRENQGIPEGSGLGHPHPPLPEIPEIDPNRPPISLDPPNLPPLPLPVDPPEDIYTTLGSDVIPTPLRTDDTPDIPEYIQDAVRDVRNIVEYDYARVDVDLTELSDEIKEIESDWGRFVSSVIGAGVGLTTTADRFLEVGGKSVSDFVNERSRIRNLFLEREQLRTNLEENQGLMRTYTERARGEREELNQLKKRYESAPKPPKQVGRPSRQVKQAYKDYFDKKQDYDLAVGRFKDLTGEDFNDRFRATGRQGARMRPTIQKTGATIPKLQREIESERDRINNINHKYKFGDNPRRVFSQEQIRDRQLRTKLEVDIIRIEAIQNPSARDRARLIETREQLSRIPDTQTTFPAELEPSEDARGVDIEQGVFNKYGIVEDIMQLSELSAKVLDMGMKANIGYTIGGEVYDTGIPTAIYNTASTILGYGEKVDLDSEAYQPITRESIGLPVESAGFIDLTKEKPKYDLGGFKMNKPPPPTKVNEIDEDKLIVEDVEEEESEVIDIDDKNITYVNDQLPTQVIGDISIIDPQYKFISAFQSNELYNDTDKIYNNIENVIEPDDNVWDINEIIGCSIEECPKPKKNTLKNKYEDNHVNPTFRPIYNNTNGKKQSNLDELIYTTTNKYNAENMKNKGYLFDGKYDNLSKTYKSNNPEISENNWNINLIN